MFSFTKTKKPAFIIKGGRMNGKKVYIKEIDDTDSKDLFNHIEVHDGTIQQIPSYQERDCVYITGSSGCGKTTYLALYAKEYKKKFKNNEIVLFSPKEEDPALKKLDILQIDINEDNFLDPDTAITPQDLEDSLVIFDDIEAIPETKLRDAVRNLRDCLLLIGRAGKTTVVTTNHLVTDNKKTRVPIIESQFFVCFPGGGGNNGIKRYFNTYCGLSNKTIEEILSNRSRWICFHSHHPQYILSKDSAKIM